MTATWQSLFDVADEFGFSEPVTKSRLAEQLHVRVVENHPDRFGGEFPSEAAKETFHRLTAAQKFVEQYEERSLVVTATELPVLLSSLVTAALTSKRQTAETVARESLTESRQELRRHYTFPRITSGAFAAAAGFLATFGDKFASNKLLAPILSSGTAQATFLAGAAYAGLFFLVTWVSESRTSRQMDYLMSESALRDIYRGIAVSAGRSNPSGRVSRREILEDIAFVARVPYHRRPSVLRLLGGTQIDLPMLERIADGQIARLVERGVLRRADITDVEVWYDVTLGTPN